MNEDVQYKLGTSSVQMRTCSTSKVDHQFGHRGTTKNSFKLMSHYP